MFVLFCVDNMKTELQPWGSLPDTIKAQAAPDMLEGKTWQYYGRPVERPSNAELRRWLPLPSFPAARSNADKRRAVAEAMQAMPRRTSARAIARMTGTSHEFVARLRREKKAREKRGIVNR